MASKPLVVVESPTKAKTIRSFLGNNYRVIASNGHIRDLPANASELPAKHKSQPWAKFGVDIDNDFKPIYVVPANKAGQVKMLKEAIKDVDIVYLATDEDREGESISWHLLDTLKPKVPVKRLVFHEITKEAIDNSLGSPREIDLQLVRAQETRRIVDRLYGYAISEILWRKIGKGLSAGRVQSPVVSMLVTREKSRIAFCSADYCSIKGTFAPGKTADQFDAELTHVGKDRVANSKDFDPNTGKLRNEAKARVLSAQEVVSLIEKLTQEKSVVESLEEKPYTSRPSAPFVTSTLQQEGNRKFRFSATRTMRIAQQLYENGFITYMRTDSTTLSEQALRAARSFIASDYGDDYLPPNPRIYTTKVRNAQEAHEAIRPAGENFTAPSVVRQQLGDDAFKLYDLIWKRTLASQMKDAHGRRMSVSLKLGDATFRASGKTIDFPGFLRAYVEGSDDPEMELADQERILPAMKEGQELITKSLDPLNRQTQAPARYTEGSLIKELEARGIGRPSTWASVVELILNRMYAFKRGNSLIPTFTAFAVVQLMEKHFSSLLDYEFTARLEDDLDAISRGEAESLSYLKNFYLGNEHQGLKQLVAQGQEEIDPRQVCGIPVGSGEDGRAFEVRIGRYGPFLSDGTNRASIPDDVAPDEMTLTKAQDLVISSAKGPTSVGNDPETGEPIFLKAGRYGPYVQLGEASSDKTKKPRMVSLLANMSLDSVDLPLALKLLSLPRNLGPHPETGEDIIVAVGKFGPYVKSGSETRSLPADRYSPLEVSLEQAVDVLKSEKRQSRGPSATPALKDLGEHPKSGAKLVIKSGRYGPYITDGTTNVTVPRGSVPEDLTLAEAVELIDNKAAEPGQKPKKKTRAKAA